MHRFIWIMLLITASFAHSETISTTDKQECMHDAKTLRCVKYLKNYDADTITIAVPDVHPLIGDHISVRVWGIDAPEIKGKNKCEKDAAIKARDLVQTVLSKARRIDLVDIDRDKYFRILAKVVVDGNSLADLLIQHKLAYAYDGGNKDSARNKAGVNWCHTEVADVAH